MAMPLSQDYNEAIQSPVSCFNDPELKCPGPNSDRSFSQINAVWIPGV